MPGPAKVYPSASWCKLWSRGLGWDRCWLKTIVWYIDGGRCDFLIASRSRAVCRNSSVLAVVVLPSLEQVVKKYVAAGKDAGKKWISTGRH